MKKIKVNLKNSAYEIWIGNHLLQKAGEVLRQMHTGKKIALVTDENVYGIYGSDLERSLKEAGFEPAFIVVRPGEESKSLESLARVYGQLLERGISRTDLVVAFGGGIVGDLAGFAASTFLRGVPLVQMPTTLLAQVDSSIGGKTAINLPQGKNLVGSFYQPQGVLIDPKFLESLDQRQFASGMAEVIKYGLIKDADLFDRLCHLDPEELPAHLEEIIATCCRIKAGFVEEDERDQGGRMRLNFGHTLGHAIESYFGYKTFSHGEAVAMGMHQITRTSESLGLTRAGTTAKVQRILEKYSLPHELPPMDREKLLEIIQKDKKADREAMTLVLLHQIGVSELKKISKNEIEQYLGV